MLIKYKLFFFWVNKYLSILKINIYNKQINKKELKKLK